MSEVGNFFQSMPLFTRYWFSLSLFFPLLGRFGLIHPAYLILDYRAFIHQFQIWRPITAAFYYPLGPSTAFSYMLNLYFLYNYSMRLETGLFDGKPAEYLFLLLFNWLTLVVSSLALNIWYFMEAMILSVLYIWCQINKDTIVTFWFGTQFKAIYLPWVLFGINFILRSGGFDELLGILVGHLYYFLAYSYPVEYGGSSLLQVPQILYDYFPNRRNASGAPGNRAPRNERRGHSWGQGHTLGN
ncbi:derlin-1-like [Uloborus diversus]|uniref:derlin-1-like n=1 Tax=Uloborus diversus TaxID=327109 RepID=UPI0024090699|nr:derlin-1-like [Uloborus diversus]